MFVRRESRGKFETKAPRAYTLALKTAATRGMKQTEDRGRLCCLNEVSDGSGREAVLPNQSMCVHFKQVSVCVCAGIEDVYRGCESVSSVQFSVLCDFCSRVVVDEAAQVSFLRRRGLDLLTEHMGRERGLLCFCKQALLLFSEKRATTQSHRATLTQKDKLFAFFSFIL